MNKNKILDYSKSFYEDQRNWSMSSAREIVPIIMRLIQLKSVIDIGCGVGTWLSVFKENGILDFLGVDGDYVDRNMLEISKEHFLSSDLKNGFLIDREFDLAISLEVAEHLPGSCAKAFVDSLTKLAPVIVFSAAIPLQVGVNHVNEQWPEYWANLFNSKDYVTIDCLRKRIWQNKNVACHYAQNILVFCKREYLKINTLLQEEYRNNNYQQLSIVHPKFYIWSMNNYLEYQIRLVDLLRTLPILIKKRIMGKLKKIINAC